MNATSAELLNGSRLEEALRDLPDWTVKNGKLHRSFGFDDFAETVGFFVRVAMVAEKMGHHPAWSGVYTSMELSLDTHEAGGITALDLDLAAQINQLVPG